MAYAFAGYLSGASYVGSPYDASGAGTVWDLGALTAYFTDQSRNTTNPVMDPAQMAALTLASWRAQSDRTALVAAAQTFFSQLRATGWTPKQWPGTTNGVSNLPLNTPWDFVDGAGNPISGVGIVYRASYDGSGRVLTVGSQEDLAELELYNRAGGNWGVPTPPGLTPPPDPPVTSGLVPVTGSNTTPVTTTALAPSGAIPADTHPTIPVVGGVVASSPSGNTKSVWLVGGLLALLFIVPKQQRS